MSTRTLSNSQWTYARRAGGALLMLPLVASLACSAAGQASSDSGAGGGGNASGAGASGSGTSTGTMGQGGGLQFDGGNNDGSMAPGCQYVDLLFVIDNSASMHDNQVTLAAAFPSFVDAMLSKLPANVDLHVGMTTSSFFTGSCSEGTINCMTAQTPQEVLDHYVKPTDGNTGTNGEQGRLFEWDGKFYYATNTSSPDPGFKTWFSAAAQAAGETGCSYEMMSAAAGYAAHPVNNPTNAGFFRDENGVLLVFILTDEPDKSPEGAQAYHDMLTAVKPNCGGDACILVAGLIDPCVQNVNNTLWQFMNSFGEAPIFGDIEDHANYSNVVGDALAQVVKQTCDEISQPH